MRYVVHENRLHNYTTVHIEFCCHARKPGHKTRNTEWFGPYQTYEEARLDAIRLGGEEPRETRCVDSV